MPSARMLEFSGVMSTAVVNCVPGTHLFRLYEALGMKVCLIVAMDSTRFA
jgi:hypothetical protein